MSDDGKESLKIGSLLITVLALIGGVGYAAGNYPTRTEWDKAREKADKQVDKMKSDLNNMKLEQVKLRSSMEKIEDSQMRVETTSKEISQKLDEALNPKAKRRKR